MPPHTVTTTTPPGPHLPAVAQTAALLHDPVGFLHRCRHRHGDVFTTRVVGVPGLVYVGTAELARRVFATDRDVGRAGEARRDFLESLVGPRSLLCLDGEAWTRQRRFLGPAFHSRHAQRYREQMAAIAADHACRWPLDKPFALRPRMQAITLEVILRVVLGVRDSDRVERLRTLLPRLLAASDSGGLLALLPTPARGRLERALVRLPGSPVARFSALLAATDEILYDEIARRRAARDRDGATDVLSTLLAARDEHGSEMSDAELRDGLMTLLVAGHETTATALAWAFERLVRHPDVLARIGDGDGRYLDAVARETLRTRPVFAEMPRVLVEPLELGGYRIPAGWYVSPAAPLLHDDPHEFPAPHAFRPERFLADTFSTQAWIPFGGGRRHCTGSQFALLEMTAVIPQVLAHLRLRPTDPAPEKVRIRNGTLAPARGARVLAQAR